MRSCFRAHTSAWTRERGWAMLTEVSVSMVPGRGDITSTRSPRQAASSTLCVAKTMVV